MKSCLDGKEKYCIFWWVSSFRMSKEKWRLQKCLNAWALLDVGQNVYFEDENNEPPSITKVWAKTFSIVKREETGHVMCEIRSTARTGKTGAFKALASLLIPPDNISRYLRSVKHISNQLTICCSFCLSVCLSVCSSVCLFVCSSVCSSVCLSVCLSVYLK